MVHVVSETGGPKGKDYCILYNPQWAHLPHDLAKAVSTHSGPPPWGPASLGCSGAPPPALGSGLFCRLPPSTPQPASGVTR